MKRLDRSGLGGLRAAALAALALCPACTSPAQGYRPDTNDPDARLEQLYAAYEEGRDLKKEGRGTLVYDPARMRHEIERLAVDFPRHAPTLFACAAIAYDERQYDRSAAYLDALFSVQPAHPEAGVLRSRLAIRDGNLARAGDLLAQQVHYTPDHAGLREALAGVLYLRGDLRGAEEELAMAGRLGAPQWRVDFNRGLVAEAEGRGADAVGFYARALDANPDWAPAASRLAGLQAASGEALR